MALKTMHSSTQMTELGVPELILSVVTQGSALLDLPRRQLVDVLSPILTNDADPVSSRSSAHDPIEVGDEPRVCPQRTDYDGYEATDRREATDATAFPKRVRRMARHDRETGHDQQHVADTDVDLRIETQSQVREREVTVQPDVEWQSSKAPPRGEDESCDQKHDHASRELRAKHDREIARRTSRSLSH